MYYFVLLYYTSITIYYYWPITIKWQDVSNYELEIIITKLLLTNMFKIKKLIKLWIRKYIKLSFKSILCSPKLHSVGEQYSKNSNIGNNYYNSIILQFLETM